MSHAQFNLRVLRGDEGSADARDMEWLRVFRHFDPRLRDFFARRETTLTIDEIVGDLWGRAFLSVATLSDTRALWSWLTAIGNNLLRDQARSSRRRPTISIADAESAAETEQHFVTAWLEDEERASVVGEVERLIVELAPADRELLHMVAVDGLSHDEIATHLGLPSAAASRQRLRRLRLQIQAKHRRGAAVESVSIAKETKP